MINECRFVKGSAFSHPTLTSMKNIILSYVAILLLTSCSEHKMEVATSDAAPIDEQVYRDQLTNSDTQYSSTDEGPTEGESAPAAGRYLKQEVTALDASVAKQVSKNSSGNTQTSPTPSVYSNGKRVIKTANIRFQVKDVNETMRALEPIIIRFNGYVANSNLELDHPNLENKMSIRVPNDHFDDLMRELDQQSIYMNFRNVTTQDVSKEFVDLESRLKTKREVEQRYMEILRKKTGTIEDVLAAEEKIGYLHEEIEATIARINYLRDQVTYSTINLEFYQILKEKLMAEEEAPGFFQEAGTSMMAGWNGVKKITLALLNIWPVLLFFGTGIYFLIRKKKVVVETVKN